MFDYTFLILVLRDSSLLVIVGIGKHVKDNIPYDVLPPPRRGSQVR